MSNSKKKVAVVTDRAFFNSNYATKDDEFEYIHVWAAESIKWLQIDYVRIDVEHLNQQGEHILVKEYQDIYHWIVADSRKQRMNKTIDAMKEAASDQVPRWFGDSAIIVAIMSGTIIWSLAIVNRLF